MFRIISDRMLKLRDLWIDNHPKNIEFYEPLSEKTMKHKKMLLLASSVVIIAFSLGVKITSFSGIKFEHMPDTNALVGILFWVVLYEAIIFMVSFYSDLKAWDFKRSVFNADKLLQVTGYLIDHVRVISSLLELHSEDLSILRARANSNISNSSINQLESYVSLEKSLSSILSNLKYSQFHGGSLDNSVTSFINQVQEFNTTKSYLRSKKLVTYILDFFIPVVIFMLALFMSYRDGVSVFWKIIDSLI
ncbi:hypothetical protein [Photobacterium kishitanii]|uniref:hypothetical protein n=1 Tax=Photobacterium kishitanii TaxID=318456 RepID=UPI00273997D0|nr:hypothetical protein [Photobacterium kishitanii]